MQKILNLKCLRSLKLYDQKNKNVKNESKKLFLDSKNKKYLNFIEIWLFFVRIIEIWLFEIESYVESCNI